MKLNQKYTAVVAITGLIVAGCANSPKKVADVEAPRKTYTEEAENRAVISSAANEVKAHQFVEINFKPGTHSISESSKRSLDRLMASSLNEGEIDEILVMSWADNELPSAQRKTLSKNEIELAKKRNQTVEKYLKQKRSVDVDLYNMAEQPNVFAKWFNTTDARLKKSLVAAGLPTTADDPQYPSKASTSVILVKLKE